MSIQDRNKDTGRPQSRRLGRRAFIDTSLKLATGIAAAPLLLAAEPVFRPFVDGGGRVDAQDGPKEVSLPKSPVWVEPYSPRSASTDEERLAEETRKRDLKTELTRAHNQLIKTLRFMKGTEYPEFVRVVDSFLERNGQGREEDLGTFTIKQTLRLNSINDPEQLSSKALYYVKTGVNDLLPNQFNIGIFWVNKMASNPEYQPDNVDGMLRFYEAMLIVDGISSLARNAGSVQEAINITNQSASKIASSAVERWRQARQDISDQNLAAQWGLRFNSESPVVADDEKAPPPAS